MSEGPIAAQVVPQPQEEGLVAAIAVLHGAEQLIAEPLTRTDIGRLRRLVTCSLLQVLAWPLVICGLVVVVQMPGDIRRADRAERDGIRALGRHGNPAGLASSGLGEQPDGIHCLHHLLAGDLELSCDKFLLAGADRQMLVIYQAEPGSRSEEALTFLAAATASTSRDGREATTSVRTNDR